MELVITFSRQWLLYSFPHGVHNVSSRVFHGWTFYIPN